MSALTRTTTRNRSGCVGVSLYRRKYDLRAGTVVRSYWTATYPGRVRRFSIDTLGMREAFREAVRCRAEWVQRHGPVETARLRASAKARFDRYRVRNQAKLAARRRAYWLRNRDRLNAQQNARSAARRAAK